MKIYRKIEDIPENIQQPSVTIGNFDGVHLGHQQLFDAVKNCAAERGGVSVVVTFDPHPLQVLKPGGIKLISTTEQKIECIQQSGIDILVIIPFNRDFAATTAEDFVRQVLVDRLGVRDLFVGYDYAFGKGRVGDSEFLKAQGESRGFSVTVIEPFYKDSAIVSSTRVRELVMQGRMVDTAELLGRFYQIRGMVQHGKRRGAKEIGFPTANLHISEEDLVPRRGVYVCEVIYDETCYGGVINVGYNPTFSEGVLIAEVHIFDFNKDIYGKPIKVNLLKFMREEEKFSSIEALSEQIAKDVLMARTVLVQFADEGKGYSW